MCEPLEQVLCYEGPDGTVGVGACREGLVACLPDGSAYSECRDQILPTEELCGTAEDDDCDGEINEGCACVPGTYRACYSGPPGTQGVGLCTAGTQWCGEDGLAYDACSGEVVPVAEDCTTPLDEDCDGEVNEADMCVCKPGDVASCYGGPPETEGVGICTAGTMTCVPEGGAFGPCIGDQGPEQEDCDTPEDDDCNGQSNEPAANCSCDPGDERSCYGGASATIGVGTCELGTQTCVGSGDGYGDCEGDVLPVSENCGTPVDDDCDGTINEESAGCECTPSTTELCYTGPMFTQDVGTCRAGIRTCNGAGKWGVCIDEIIPTDDDCNTPLDENCDGSVNEPASGCFCGLEYVDTLESEDCVLNYGETTWKTLIPAQPHEIGADTFGNAYPLMPTIPDAELFEFEDVFDPVPGNLVPVALFARYIPNGMFVWGAEITGAVAPPIGPSHAWNMDVSPYGTIAITAPHASGLETAFGSFSYQWPASTFRILYSIDPFGYPYFALALPRYSVGMETNTSVHSIAAKDDGGVFYVNGPINSHVHSYDFEGVLAWNFDLELSLDDVAVVALEDGGAIVAFTTNQLIDWAPLEIPPIVGSSSDLVLARFTPTGSVTWAVRSVTSAAIVSAEEDNGIVAVLEAGRVLRFDVTDGSLTSIDPIPGAAIPASSFALVGSNAVLHSRTNAPAVDFGFGFEQDPYGAQATGTFVALREHGETRWARAPLMNHVTVGAAAPNLVFSAFPATDYYDLDGLLVSIEDPSVFLTRMAY